MLIDHATAHAEISAAFASYEAALMENDLEALDALFWRSPSTVRFGVGESLFGFDAIAAFRVGRTGGSPQRKLQATQIVCFNECYAVATTEFIREGEARVGRQSQSWVKFPEHGWRIVSAHVSLAAEKS
jgi:hypothetical protein